MKICQKCEVRQHPKARICSNCGATLPETEETPMPPSYTPPPKNKTKQIVRYVVTILIVLIAGYFVKKNIEQKKETIPETQTENIAPADSTKTENIAPADSTETETPTTEQTE